MSNFVVPLADPSADLALVGGKGSSLAKLASAGLPVPPGFHVTTEAYKAFVERNGLQPRILDAVRDEPALASKVILGFFQDCEMPDVIATPVGEAYAQLGGAVAVRSSATAEDLPDASFAGQQDTYLDVRGQADVLDTVQRCWASLWTARAIEYRARHGIAAGEVSLAVVVQRMVPADVAGVLFTADPVSGADDRFVVNAVQGLGEALVSGQADPHVIVVDRASLRISQQRGKPVMDEEGVRELARLGAQIENMYRRPMDIEWARHDREVFIVQARPITVAAYEDWNSSVAGDYVWTCANLGEAIPSVMTPATWSLVQVFMSEAMSLPSLGPHRSCGNIGGRFYLNLSLAMAAGSALGLGGLVRRASEQAFGRIPQDLEIPPLPIPRWKVLVELVPTAAAFLRRIRSYQKNLPALIAAAPGRCAAIKATIARTTAARELADLWRTDVEPLLRDTSRMLAAGARLDGAGLVRIRPWLIKRVGEGDANALLSGLSANGPLASLGPVVGLDQLARGEIDHDEFVRQWGHRCPDEFEVSVPRPAEDPAWIDRDLAGIRQAPTDVRALLARQEQARAAALERFKAKYPAEVNRLQKRIAGAARAARGREAARSEVIRAFWVLRSFILRAGVLTDAGDDVFFLPIGEILTVLGGGREPLGRVPARRNTYRRYAALPAYPTLIRGRFDPFRWAANEHRRGDVFDETRALAPLGDAITGFPGAAGVVEGTARVLTSVEQGAELRAGEVLVTTVTNVGWTPLFPRAAAVITDVGAPLSHAAIVARELGIPAVVGTGNATSRLHTGDRVRVDGERGLVEVLSPGG